MFEKMFEKFILEKINYVLFKTQEKDFQIFSENLRNFQTKHFGAAEWTDFLKIFLRIF